MSPLATLLMPALFMGAVFFVLLGVIAFVSLLLEDTRRNRGRRVQPNIPPPPGRPFPGNPPNPRQRIGACPTCGHHPHPQRSA